MVGWEEAFFEEFRAEGLAFFAIEASVAVGVELTSQFGLPFADTFVAAANVAHGRSELVIVELSIVIGVVLFEHVRGRDVMVTTAAEATAKRSTLLGIEHVEE